jgi:hypothetical protein
MSAFQAAYIGSPLPSRESIHAAASPPIMANARTGGFAFVIKNAFAGPFLLLRSSAHVALPLPVLSGCREASLFIADHAHVGSSLSLQSLPRIGFSPLLITRTQMRPSVLASTFANTVPTLPPRIFAHIGLASAVSGVSWTEALSSAVDYVWSGPTLALRSST